MSLLLSLNYIEFQFSKLNFQSFLKAAQKVFLIGHDIYFESTSTSIYRILNYRMLPKVKKNPSENNH